MIPQGRPARPAREEAGALRVLWITSTYPSGTNDPRGIFLHRLARALAREGVHVTVLSPGAPRAAARESLDGVRVERAAYWINRGQALTAGLAGIVPNLRQRPWLLAQVPALVCALTARALRLAPAFDLVHAHWLYPAGIAAVVAARRRPIPLVVTAHGTDLALAAHSRVLRWISRRVLRRAHACVGISHAVCDDLVTLGAPADRVHFLPLGVDIDASSATPVAEDGAETLRQFERSADLRLVYVGRLIPVKSVETLLAAHRELEARGRSVATALVGSGSSEARLRRLASDLSHVHFVGALAPTAVSNWIHAAHVLVLPSLSEGRGVALLEAMAAERPVVASDIPGPRELVRPGITGLLFPPGDARRLADTLDLLRDESLRRRLGAGGRAWLEAEGLWADQTAQRHRDLYELVAASHSGAR